MKICLVPFDKKDQWEMRKFVVPSFLIQQRSSSNYSLPAHVYFVPFLNHVVFHFLIETRRKASSFNKEGESKLFFGVIVIVQSLGRYLKLLLAHPTKTFT